jgi:hypothetical protein
MKFEDDIVGQTYHAKISGGFYHVIVVEKRPAMSMILTDDKFVIRHRKMLKSLPKLRAAEELFPCRCKDF